MLYAVLGAVAQFERNVLRESTVTGMRAAKKRGEHIGRPSALSPVRKGEMEEIDVPEVDPAFVTIIDAFATNRRVNHHREPERTNDVVRLSEGKWEDVCHFCNGNSS